MAEIILFRGFEITYNQLKGTVPPLGLLYVAKPLVDKGLTVRIYDAPFSPNWKKDVLKELNDDTICVGITSTTGPQIKGGLGFTNYIKSIRPDLPVVWGGPQCTSDPSLTIENKNIDIIVLNDGEETFYELVNTIKSNDDLSKVDGIWYKKGNKVYKNPTRLNANLDDTDVLPYHLIDINRYIENHYRAKPFQERWMPLNTSRGCHIGCRFCHESKIKWRPQNAQNVANHIKYIVEKYNIETIDFVDSQYFINKDRSVEISKLLIVNNIKINWEANCTITQFYGWIQNGDEAIIELFKKSGCTRMRFGVESGSEKVLEFINKRIPKHKLMAVDKMLIKHEINSTYNFMIGLPHETELDIKQTLKLMDEMWLNNPKTTKTTLSVFTPLPGNPLYDYCLKLGFKPAKKLEDYMSIIEEKPLFSQVDIWNQSWLKPDLIELIEKAIVVNRRRSEKPEDRKDDLNYMLLSSLQTD